MQEQVHWLTLIIGHVIADGADGETPTIPRSLVSLKSTNSKHHVVEISTHMFQLLDALAFPLDSIQHQECSPLLIESIFWFLNRWASTYLFLESGNYPGLDQILAVSFGAEGQGHQALEFLLLKMNHHINLWYTEGDVVSMIVSLLDTLSKIRNCRNALLASRKIRLI